MQYEGRSGSLGVNNNRRDVQWSVLSKFALMETDSFVESVTAKKVTTETVNTRTLRWLLALRSSPSISQSRDLRIRRCGCRF